MDIENPNQTRINPALAFPGPRTKRVLRAVLFFSLIVCLSGCAAFRPIEGIPVREICENLNAPIRSGQQTIDLSLLRQDPPARYLVDAGDVLGIYIEGVLGNASEVSPVNFQQDPEARSSVGYPLVVDRDGSISMPMVGPISVRGMTLWEVEQRLRKAYTVDQPVLRAGQDRVLVSLHKPRTYRVLVIRQESGNAQGNRGASGTVNFEIDKRGTGRIVRLPAYKNDVLHALAETGGLPGLDAQNAIYIIRRSKRLTVANLTGDHFLPEPQLAPVDPPNNEPAVPVLPRSAETTGDLGPLIIRGQSPLDPGFAAPSPNWRYGHVDYRTLGGMPGQPDGLLGPFGRGSYRAQPIRQNRWPGRRSMLSPRERFPVESRPTSRFASRAPSTAAPARSVPASQESTAATSPPVYDVSIPAGSEAVVAPPEANSVDSASVPETLFGGHSTDCLTDAVDCSCPPEDVFDWTTTVADWSSTVLGPNVVKIPLRMHPGDQPAFNREESRLEDGDVVFIETRETEFFFTGGLFGGGQFILPRDYDLDVLGAISIIHAQQNISGATRAIGGPSAINQDVTVGASKVIILRRMTDGRQMPIEVDIYQALRNPEERVIIRPGDYLILRYTRLEAIAAFVERQILDGALFGISSQLADD